MISDHRVDWNIPGVRPLAPDVAVFFNVQRRDDWETFNVKAEGAIPALVVEVTSRSTRKNDLGIKVDYYHRAKVPLYLIADAVGRGAKRRVTTDRASVRTERVQTDHAGRARADLPGAGAIMDRGHARSG